jgi:hypothetical protein
MENIKYTVKGTLPPAFVTLSGQKYLVPGWIPVEDNITFENVSFINPYKKESKIFKVQGSGKNIYNVTLSGKNVTCDCPAGKFRGSCKHIEQIKKENNI